MQIHCSLRSVSQLKTTVNSVTMLNILFLPSLTVYHVTIIIANPEKNPYWGDNYLCLKLFCAYCSLHLTYISSKSLYLVSLKKLIECNLTLFTNHIVYGSWQRHSPYAFYFLFCHWCVDSYCRTHELHISSFKAVYSK